MKKKINILIVQPISQFSGSLKSILENLKIIPKKKFNFYFLTPKGISSRMLQKYGRVFASIGLTKFDNSKIGYYRNLRWLILVREFIFILPTLLICLKNKDALKKIDIIHLNEITALPSFFIIKLFSDARCILHVRTVLKTDNFFARIINIIISIKHYILP